MNAQDSFAIRSSNYFGIKKVVFSDILLFEVIQLGFVAIESLLENLIQVFIRAKALFAGKFNVLIEPKKPNRANEFT